MFCPADPRDYQSCRDRLAVVLSEIEHYEISGYPVLASISRREARRLHQLSQWLPKVHVPVSFVMHPSYAPHA